MAYSLKSLLKAKGVRRKSITLQPQYTTIEQEVALSKATLAPVRVWQANQDRLKVAYEAALSQMTRDSATDDVNSVILAIDATAQQAVVSANAMVQSWLAEFSARHARQFASRVKSATRIDPFPYIDLAAHDEDISLFLARMTSLITDINDQARKDVAEVVWRSVINRTSPKQVSKEIAERLQIARNRAMFIASDQANKVNAKLTELRQEEAGIDEFMWETAKDMRVRKEHAELQGRVFKWKQPPSVGLPGTPPRCRCTGAAHINLDDDD